MPLMFESNRWADWVDELTRSVTEQRFEIYDFPPEMAEKIVALMQNCPANLWECDDPKYFSYLVCTNRNSIAFCAYLAGWQIDARIIVQNVLDHYWKLIDPTLVTDLTSLITALRALIDNQSHYLSLFDGEPTEEEILAMFMVDALVCSDDVGGGTPFDYTLQVDLPLRADA